MVRTGGLGVRRPGFWTYCLWGSIPLSLALWETLSQHLTVTVCDSAHNPSLGSMA